MNFGERLKQIRTEKGLTQPQFAEAIGIEQSYLSKLENDKSVPSADMFGTILAGLGMDAATFLKDLNKEVLATTLRHIPAVSQFNSNAAAVKVHNYRRWLYGCALAWIIGFALMLGASDGIFVSNKVHKYVSPGVILPGESENIFEKHDEILIFQMTARNITFEEQQKLMWEFKANRVRPITVETRDDRGSFYVEPAQGGHRRFELVESRRVQAPANRIIQFVGAIFIFCGFVGLFIEWRLRRIQRKSL
jgi:transcriptional regulator with XRE-family HTH domain